MGTLAYRTCKHRFKDHRMHIIVAPVVSAAVTSDHQREATRAPHFPSPPPLVDPSLSSSSRHAFSGIADGSVVDAILR